MTERAIKLLVWGLVFILIDIRIVTFDLVHDLIGYFLLYKGMNSLPQSRWLTYAKFSTVILGILSLTEIVGYSYIDLNAIDQDITLHVVMAGITSILSLFFHLNLLAGLLQLLNEDEHEELYRSLTKFKTFYLAFNLVLIMTLPSILVFREEFAMYLIVMIVAGLIVEIVYIIKINTFKRFAGSEEPAS